VCLGSGVARGVKWDHAPRGAGLGGAITLLQSGAVHKRRPQPGGGGFIQCGQGGRGFFRCGRPQFLAQKNSGFFEIYDVTARTRGRGLSQCGHFADKGRGHFSRFFAGVFYGRPLIQNTFLSRSLDQNMLKNAYFLEEKHKIAAASGNPPPNTHLLPAAGGSAPRSPYCYSRLLLQL